MWARRAADQGDVYGEFLLGSIYRNGDGAPIDLRASASWYARSAAQGYEPAKTQLRELAVEGVPEAVAAARRLGLTSP